MPHHSRERERGEYRSRDRDRRQYHYEQANTHDRHEYTSHTYDDYGNDIQDSDDGDDDAVFNDRRRSRHSRRNSSSHPQARPSPARRTQLNPSHRPQQPQQRTRRQGRSYDSDDDDGDDSESAVIVVDSRPNVSRPAHVRPSPVRVERRRSRSRTVENTHNTGIRDSRYKSKESPATSPIKKRDRERDREGRRRRDSMADEESPRKGRLRDRRRKGLNDDDEEHDVRGGFGTDRERDKRRKEKEKYLPRESGVWNKQSKHASTDSANSATQLLSVDALAKLNAAQMKAEAVEKAKTAKDEKALLEKERKRRKREEAREKERRIPVQKGAKSKGWAGRRLVSGAFLEEGRSPELKTRGGGGRGVWKDEKGRKGAAGGGGDDDKGGGWFASWSKKKKLCVSAGVLALLLIIIIPVAAVLSKNKKADQGASDDSGDGPSDPASQGPPPRTELGNFDPNTLPESAKKTYFDPRTWYDTADMNVTYTDETVGGLPIMGLNSTWDDSAQANKNVPPLNKKFPYGKQPIRGVNVGGWLSLEPFITPSFFSNYNFRDNVVDEYTLSKKLAPNAAQYIEKHYATFINEQSFREIRDAGLDHVRIPYSYWLVKTYDDDPYVERIGWRYLLRAIEYCRKYGLRVNLDLHGVQGSQNGWNHSGRQGSIGWLEGNDGTKNGDRSLETHKQLATFFAQERYKNVVTIYGLANEPMMLKLDIEAVINWNTKAISIIRESGLKDAKIAFGDGFLNLEKWKTIMQDVDDNLLLDTHQYTVFNTGQVGLPHRKKLDFVCEAWVNLITKSNTKGTGWGPTICGEWSQADTDCAKYLNNVNVGSRWLGTMDNPQAKDQVLQAHCPTQWPQGDPAANGPPCSCDQANADPSHYSDSYKKYLQMYAEAQMYAFEKGYGWFYWTWQTESAAQWSYKKGLDAGILPKKAYEPEFKCENDKLGSFGDLEEYY
ncbi:beta-glucosidase [Histoplasma capsulatum var. duboisii H88]|uniref:glucan 1,3-beta-glucosidase n=2 Tax=Ajellomyces capsulatus (strain H88) TaxID=544711 RepID=F0UU58_AJEC8|nr:beta-glucosidase [Histoplasma capsulatum var. duboisii H88]